MDKAWPPLVISVAPNGAYKTKKDHPGLPMTTKELADTAAACCDAGAAMIHLHVRDPDGVHLLDEHAYRAATAAVIRAVGNKMVVQITSEAGGRYQRHEQMAVVRAVVPEAVSIALREIVPDAAAEPEAAEFFAWMRRERILIQSIVFSPEELTRYYDLRERGVLGDGPDFLLFVLGRYTAGQVSSPSDLLPYLAVYRGGTPWSMCAFGPREHACALTAAALGGHVRVGFENNLYVSSGSQAPDNAALVRQAV
jgi:3-keto-5-aminohexanoate cleavage enzyme